MGDLTDPVSPSPPPPSSSTAVVAVYSPVVLTTPTTQSRPVPVREDCWSEEATSTLVDSWGRRYMELNRGNLRQKDWQEVADAVNALHGHTKKTHRTDVQCKNRIDTIKKKYKVEKARIVSSNGTLTSSWPFFDRMDVLIGSSVKSTPAKVSAFPKSSSSLPLAVALPLPYRKSMTTSIPTASIVAGLPQKRTASPMIHEDEGFSFRRKQIDRNNYSMAAAAAAAAAAAESEDEEAEAEEEEEEELEVEGEGEGVRKLAKAIERFGAVYERVEGEKLRQVVELEKQRMQFSKDLELQRMKMFMDTQVQLERIKTGKRSTSNDIYS